MPKLVRSRNYHSLPVQQSPSSALPSSLYVKQPQHLTYNTVVNSSSIPFLSSYSPVTQWDTPEQHQQQQRKVSEEDMYQNHHTCAGSSIDNENRNGSNSGCDCDQLLSHSLSSVSSSSSSNTSTATLTRRKPSVCLTDLVQNEKDSLCAAISPIMTSVNQRDQRIIDVRQDLFSIRPCEVGGSPPSEWWGHFTSTANDDSFANEVDDPEDIMFPPHEDCWDYNTMAHATSFIPIKQRPNHCNYYTTHSSTYNSQPYVSVVNVSPSSMSGGTSWRVALWSTNLNTKSKNMHFDQHNHPYKKSFPTMTRQTIISRSSVSSQQPSIDRCGNHSIDSDEQQQSIGLQLQSSSSSSSFDEFILTCPNNFSNTDSSMDIATQRMSGLGL